LSETSKVARLASDSRRFVAELAGTFVIVVLATGSAVINARFGGALGVPFEALCPAVAVALMVYAFGKVSMAHFNPAVTVGFLITGHTTRRQFFVYLGAEIIGALLASAFVYFVIGTKTNFGANRPDYSFPLPLIIGVEVLATALLMAVICAVVYTRGLRGFGGIAIGGIVGLDILFLSFISGASMNPARALAPALLSGHVSDLWLYWTATFAGSSAVATLARKKFR
jgi:aquaporin Z